MEPFVIRRTVAEKSDTAPARNRKPRPVARVRYPPVVVSTGLPPLVDGQIRCFLKLTIRRLRLAQSDLSEHNDLLVRVKWWGEPSDGAYFKPICGRKKSGRLITARYAVRCGPKQFAAYLMDASALTLDLLVEGAQDKVMGVANITDVVNLSMQNPVIGWYKMLAIPNHKHVADVHVNMSFCELQDIYGESSGTGTGTERSQEESDDSTSQVDVGRTYRVEKNFVENADIAKQNANRISDEMLLRSEVNARPKNRLSGSSVTNEVDRLIERAELLKMLISPDPGQLPPSTRRPNSEMDFDADNSLSDASLITDLFYGKPKTASESGRTDFAVQVSPSRSPKKPALRSPAPPESSSPRPPFVVRSPGKSPRFEVRRVTSPKVVKFADTEAQKKTVPTELIALLRRVNGAVVRIHALRLSPGDFRHFISGSIPRRSAPGLASSLSKPPRPMKITFFVNAQLPTGEMCQLTRICGKADLETNIIDFDQSEGIPLTLNDNKISLWLESAAVTFRVSCRHASVHRTQPVGVSVFSLEPLLFSENFKSRQHVALSTRNPGSTMEISVELQIAAFSEMEQAILDEEKLDREKQAVEERKAESPRKAEFIVPSPTPQPTVQQTTPLVLMFCVTEVEFCDSFVKRMASAASVVQSVSQENRWEVYLTAAAFSQPRRSSSRRHVDMKSPCNFAPKLQLYYVYNLDAATAIRFEDNHLVVELRRHVAADEDDQLLAICKVSLHQFYLAFACDPVATSAVMRSPGPVISVCNEFLPADDPFTLASVARLRCTLAAGSADQIAHFNAVTMNREMMQSPSGRNLTVDTKESHIHHHYRQQQQPSNSRENDSSNSLTLTISELDQLFIPVEPTESGAANEAEADVFVSYQFPSLAGLRSGETSRPEVRTFKTPMRPYHGPASSISFGNEARNTHDFSSALDSTNLLADLVRNFSFLTTHSATLGVDFVVSMRLYRPIVRDVTVGYATLSLTRLASLITSTKSAKHRQHIFVRLPITPTGQHHTVGWLTVRLDLSSCFSGGSNETSQQKPHHEEPSASINQGQFRITVKRAFNLRSAAHHLGLRMSTSSTGFKTYCALKTSTALTTKSECEVSERSYCPVFKMSQFEISMKNSRPEDLELQLIARDRRQGDLLIGGLVIPATLIETLTRFRPRCPAPFLFPLLCDQSVTNSDILMENSVGSVEFDLQLPVPSTQFLPATIPSWFHCEPRAKISLFVDRIVFALPVASFSNLAEVDEVFKCRLSIGDSYSSPLSISTARPQSAVYNEEDVIVISTCKGSIILEHAVPCPPLGEIVDFLSRCHAKIEVQLNGMTQFCQISLLQLLAKQTVPGQFPLISPESVDFFGSCVYARVAVDSLSSSSGNAIKDRLFGRSLKKESECFVASVGVSRALHLPQHLLDKEVYIVVGALEPLRTHNVPSGDRPIWNFTAEALVPFDLLKAGGLIFRLHTTNSSNNVNRHHLHEDDPIVAYASVDLTSLSLGIGQISGWYHLTDAFGHCLGQILVSVQPIEDVYQPPPPSFAACSAPVMPRPPSSSVDINKQQNDVDVQTDFNIIAEPVPPPPATTTSGPRIDAEQLESLSRRIARLLADPLPPRFQSATVEEATETSPREKSRPVVVDNMTETEIPQKVESSTQKSKSSSSSSSSSSNSSVVQQNKQLAESPDLVQMMFDVDQILATATTTAEPFRSPSPPCLCQRPAFVSTVDEHLFAASDCNHSINLRSSREFNGGGGGGGESEDERSHHFAMSPSVIELEQQHATNSQIESPPALDVASQASTEEWSHHTDHQEPSTTAVDDFLAFGGGEDVTLNDNNNKTTEQAFADWSTIHQFEQLDSPHQSSSPVSARLNNGSGMVRPDDVPSYFDEQKQPVSLSSTPKLDDFLTSQPNSDSNRRKTRRSPPAWIADAQDKLSTALPSFFPHPDSLRSALERVRFQQRNENGGGDNSVINTTTGSNTTTRRPLPTFDVDEARRIARIFSSAK